MQEAVANLGQETAMRAIIISGDHLDDIENIMSKVQSTLTANECVQLANINSQSQVVLSGTADGVDKACSILQAKGWAGRAVDLPVSAPFHCELMRPAEVPMKRAFEKVLFKKTIIPVISNVTALPVRFHKLWFDGVCLFSTAPCVF